MGRGHRSGLLRGPARAQNGLPPTACHSEQTLSFRAGREHTSQSLPVLTGKRLEGLDETHTISVFTLVVWLERVCGGAPQGTPLRDVQTCGGIRRGASPGATEGRPARSPRGVPAWPSPLR